MIRDQKILPAAWFPSLGAARSGGLGSQTATSARQNIVIVVKLGAVARKLKPPKSLV
jgi:hypothetical protein